MTTLEELSKGFVKEPIIGDIKESIEGEFHEIRVYTGKGAFGAERWHTVHKCPVKYAPLPQCRAEGKTALDIMREEYKRRSAEIMETVKDE